MNEEAYTILFGFTAVVEQVSTLECLDFLSWFSYLRDSNDVSVDAFNLCFKVVQVQFFRECSYIICSDVERCLGDG